MMTARVVGRFDELTRLSHDGLMWHIKTEPMFFGADPRFVHEHTQAFSPTRGFITALITHTGHSDWIVDSRVHMLKPEWYPCIGGWHFDEVKRSYKGQPLHTDIMGTDVEHAVMVVGETSMTEFLPVCDIPAVTEKYIDGGYNTYEVIDGYVKAVSPEVRVAESGAIYLIDSKTLHRGVAADRDGWRFFVRASRKSARKVENQIRTQVQTYIPYGKGW